jgi:hypothetical protein
MCTRSMNLGCFCMVFFDVLIFSPFVTNTVWHGSFRRACCEGCLSTSAKLVPWHIFKSHDERNGLNEPARAALARQCLGVAQ